MLAQNQDKSSQHNKALVEFHRRLALPFACVVFSLIALPLSIQTAWAHRSVGFGVSLGIILLYYLLLTAGETFGKRGILSPAIALWIPNVVLGSIGLYLFYRVAQEKLPLAVKALSRDELVELDRQRRLGTLYQPPVATDEALEAKADVLVDSVAFPERSADVFLGV